MSDELKTARSSSLDDAALHASVDSTSSLEAGPRPATDATARASHMLGTAASALGGALVQRKLAQRWVQRKGAGEGETEQVHAAAERGLSGSAQSLPHLDKIQGAFGGHDVSGVHAHVGGAAEGASRDMGASAYAVGNSVAFAGAPDLHTAAHEAAHVVLQRGGVSLKGGVGQEGDSYERNADAVADRVVAGQSAADLLPHAGGASAGAVQHKRGPVQLLGDPLSKPASADNKPPESIDYHVQDDATGQWENHPKPGEVRERNPDTGKMETTQRRYPFGQYQAMWEKEHGRPMNEKELETLRRGCIGITVLNIGAKGNPPLGEAYNSFEQAHARMADVQKLIKEHPKMWAQDLQKAGIPLNLEFSGPIGQYQAAMFAKLFWSNQKKQPNQQDFEKGSQDFDKTNKWEKKPLVLPTGETVEQYIKVHGREALMKYIKETLGEAKFKEMLDANHQDNVDAYYLAWAKAVETSDPNAFPVDPKTGHVDMSKYTEYHGRPKIEEEKGKEKYKGTYVNFDYGFWDEGSQCFWHANHMQYDGEKGKMQPMMVYQSTKEKFIAGYFDFDRVIFCVGLAPAYSPADAARTHG